jgi:hypothetical protein
MHFLKLDKLLPIESTKDLYLFWLTCLAFQKNHRHLEKALANYVFLASNKARKNIIFDSVLDDITYEFNALETVGDSDTGEFERGDSANKQWRRLDTRVNKEYIKFIGQEE